MPSRSIYNNDAAVAFELPLQFEANSPFSSSGEIISANEYDLQLEETTVEPEFDLYTITEEELDDSMFSAVGETFFSDEAFPGSEDEIDNESENNRADSLFEILENETLETELESEIAAVIPPLIGIDTTVPGYTAYVKIPIGRGNYNLDLTGIYIPPHFNPARSCCVIVYLHGITNTFPGPNAKMNEYWKLTKLPDYDLRLREEVQSASANTILVAPSLGNSPNVYFNKLSGRKGGLDKYLQAVLMAVNKYIINDRFQTNINAFDQVILAAHSAGGKQMLMIATNENPISAPRIRECWGFDSLYSGVKVWEQWVRRNPDKKLFIYFKGSTRQNAKSLEAVTKGLTNIQVIGSNSRNHYWVPKAHLKERISGLQTVVSKKFEFALIDEAGYDSYLSENLFESEAPALNIYGERGGGRVSIKRDPDPGDIAYIGSYPVHRHTKTAWEALVAAARSAGFPAPLLMPKSGYRSYEHQKKLWEAALQKYGSPEIARKWVAPPGGSAHQSGRAIDFDLGTPNSKESVDTQRKLPVYKWLVQNAQNFGFYPYEAEPWHWEHNPPAVALNFSTPVVTNPPAYSSTPAININIPNAVRLNEKYARELGWIKYADIINNLLLTVTNERNMSLGPEAFAKAVSAWQQQQGFSAKDSDGVIGPNTWRVMKTQLNIQTPVTPASPATNIIIPGNGSAEEEWSSYPEIRAHYQNWQAYKTVRDSVVKWVADPASYINAAISEWKGNPSIHSHFNSKFDGLPHNTSYINLKRLYEKAGIRNPASYFAGNIVPINFFGHKTYGHKKLRAALADAEASLRSSGFNVVLRSAWSFVPRTMNHDINKISNHAFGTAIDFDPGNNPHIMSRDEIVVINSVCSDTLPNGLLATTDPATLGRASDRFRQNFNEAWIQRQTDSSLRAAINRSRKNLDKYAANGFMTLPVTFIKALQNTGLNWGGTWSSAKDFMHFELRGVI